MDVKRRSSSGALLCIIGKISTALHYFKEELFGPVASFYKVENEQAAIDLYK
jgi:succinate-semialdehyde dehydrogenase/glutarate-semialdehyde dehydrogenase